MTDWIDQDVLCKGEAEMGYRTTRRQIRRMKSNRYDLTVTGCGCPGIYTLDCYCDIKSKDHEFNEFPHQFTDELGSRCRAMARKAGWLLDFRKERYLCPKCNPRARRAASSMGCRGRRSADERPCVQDSRKKLKTPKTNGVQGEIQTPEHGRLSH